jgi:hypothetical protein
MASTTGPFTRLLSGAKLTDVVCYMCAKKIEDHVPANPSILTRKNGTKNIFLSVNCLKKWIYMLYGEQDPWDYNEAKIYGR